MTNEISELKNLGPKSQAWLNEIGVFTRAELERIGAVEVYRLLKESGVPATMNLVYAIDAALCDIHWTKLPAELKMELRNQIQGRKQ